MVSRYTVTTTSQTSEEFQKTSVNFYCFAFSDIFPKRRNVERKHSRNLSVTINRTSSTFPPSIFPSWQTVDGNIDRTDQV